MTSRRHIPGFYYDEAADAYFAIPKDGCTVSNSAYDGKKEKRGDRDGNGRAKGSSKTRGRNAARKQLEAKRTFQPNLTSVIRRRECGASRGAGELQLRALQSAGLSAWEWIRRDPRPPSLHDSDADEEPPQPDTLQGCTGVAITAGPGLVITGGHQGVAALDIRGPQPPAARPSSSLLLHKPSFSCIWTMRLPTCSSLALCPRSEGPLPPATDLSLAQGGVLPLLAVTTLGGAGKAGALHVVRLRAAPTWGGRQEESSHWTTPHASVWTCDWQPGGRAVSVGSTRRVMVFDITRGSFISRKAQSEVLAQRFLPTGQVLANGGRDGCIWLLDTRTGAGVLPCMQEKSSVCGLLALSDSHGIISASMGGHLSRWDLRSPARPLLSFPHHVNSCSMIAPTMDASERLLFAGGRDGRLRAWDLAKGSLLLETSPHADSTSPPRVAPVCEWGDHPWLGGPVWVSTEEQMLSRLETMALRAP